MVPEYYQFTPFVLNQSAPTTVQIEAFFINAPTAVKINLAATGTDVVLTPDASGKRFTGTLPASAFLTGLTAADVNRPLVGYLLVTDAGQTVPSAVFGHVLTPSVPAVTVRSVAADVQCSEHLVNIQWPALADIYSGGIDLQLAAITQKFFAHFDDEYDFLHIVFDRGYGVSPYHNRVSNAVQGIGMAPFNACAQFGSAGRLLGLSMFPAPHMFDGAGPTTNHEIAHQWISYLSFPPLQQSIPHWPLSDLAADLMGYAVPVNGGLSVGQFNYTLQPVGGGSYQMVADNQPKVLSDLSLYLMGMRPANQVGSHFVFDNQNQAVSAGGILAGPVTPVTVNDVIAHFGPRVPSSVDAQKRFRVATVLVTKSALASADTMSLYDFLAARARATAPQAYKLGFIQGTANPFSLLTQNVGRLDPRIKRNILIDASRDGGVWWFPQAGPYTATDPHQGKALADHLRGLGHLVTELPRGATVTPAALATQDVVIRVSGMGLYSAAELSAYTAWTNQGGGLLLLGEHHPSDGLAAAFGLQFAGITRGPCTLSTYAAHPLTAGLGPLAYGAGSGILGQPASATLVGWLSATTFLDLDDDGLKDANETWAPAALGVMPYGKGRVVFCGDTSLWLQIPQPLVSNVLAWFAAPY